MKIVALVGMPGSGKSEVARVFEKHNFFRIRFGDITDEEISKRGLPLNEENERMVREELRRIHGMAAYAILNLPKIDHAILTNNVIIDGLYSWEEYLTLKSRYGNQFIVIAVWASPATRYNRLANRTIRPLSTEEAASRDKAEIEKVNKGGPIAMADITIINESTLDKLIETSEEIVMRLQ